MDCRTHQRRVEIVNDYYVTPQAHFRVLAGEIIHSDAGGDITDSYFIFKCIHKQTKEEDKICCGRPTAMDFCQLLNIPLPKIFNPLVEENDREQHNNAGANNNNGQSNRWNPARKQLYNATMLFIMFLRNKPNKILFEIKGKLEANISEEPPLSNIKSVNTLLNRYKTTAQGIIDKLAMNNPMREFNFNLVVDILENNYIEQYFYPAQ